MSLWGTINAVPFWEKNLCYVDELIENKVRFVIDYKWIFFFDSIDILLMDRQFWWDSLLSRWSFSYFKKDIWRQMPKQQDPPGRWDDIKWHINNARAKALLEHRKPRINALIQVSIQLLTHLPFFSFLQMCTFLEPAMLLLLDKYARRQLNKMEIAFCFWSL